MKRMGRGFCPDEIIFSVTDCCNLHCAHCFVSRSDSSLSADDACRFLRESEGIERVGFSGGEPFLNQDCIEQITREAVQKDLLFDRIITNGVWWRDQNELNERLSRLYDAGFDGKIAVSWDTFHAQSAQRIITFINAIHRIWQRADMVEIQSVINRTKEAEARDAQNLEALKNAFACTQSSSLCKKTGRGVIYLKNQESGVMIAIYREEQSFLSTSKSAWSAKKWFKDDFCEGPGQILFVHPNGSVAPCCGFANENSALLLGRIQDGFSSVMHNATQNAMIQLCYEHGLSSKIKEVKKELPGKTTDICAFCDFICKKAAAERT